jgi:hypothetical protein
MSAWLILIANSTAPNGSIAWLHLNSQSGGGGLIGGRADLTLIASNESLMTQDNNERVIITATTEKLTLKADKKGLTV